MSTGNATVDKSLDEFEKRIKATEDKQKAIEDEKAKAIAAGGAPSGGGNNHAPTSSDSDESRCLRYFSVGHVKDLIHVNTASPRFAHVPEHLKGLVRELKRDIDISRISQQIFYGEQLDREQKDGAEATVKVHGIIDGNYYGKNVLAPKLKAFGSTVSGSGSEWVPTALSSTYLEEYQLDRQVASQFKQINMPTDPFDLPVQSGVTTARIQGENASIADSQFVTSKLTLNAIKLTEFMILPEELNEDSAPQILTIVRDEVVQAQARAVETAILNGDTTGTHMDFDVTAASDARKAWMGLRKLALANSANGSTVDFSGAAPTTAKLRSMRTAMKKFGVNVRELVWLVSPRGYQGMVGLPEVTTMEKFGPLATILKGALAALDGIPIVISEYVRDDVSATGVNTTGGPNTFSVIHLVNSTRFYWGVRRPIRVRAVQDPTPPADRWLLASWWRGDYKGRTQSASEVSTVLGYNAI